MTIIESICAGIIAGDGSAGTKTGVAPAAKLMAVKVLDSQGYGNQGDVYGGVQNVLKYPVKNGAHAMNLSFGWQHAWGPDRAAWRQTCDNAIAGGVVMVVAAGNEGNDPWYMPPDEVRTPGDVPSVITVGATNRNDMRAPFSSRGPVTWQNVDPYNDYPYPPGLIKPDISAPGVGINSTKIDGGYTIKSGTSMATPHVSGTVALFLEKDATMKPEGVKEWLEATSIDWMVSGEKDNNYGSGRVDAYGWTVSYEANELPEVASPPWEKTQWKAEWAWVSDGILTTKTIPSEAAGIGWHRIGDMNSNSVGNILEASIKTISGHGASLRLFDGTKSIDLVIKLNRIITQSGELPEKTYYMDTTDAFHTYRIELKGSVANILVDGVSRLSTSDLMPSSSGYCSFYCISQSHNEWDYVRYYTGGF